MRLSGFKFIMKTLLDFMFPKRCIICNKLLPLGCELCLCEKCLTKVNSYEYVTELKANNNFYRIISGVEYIDYVRSNLIDFKFHNVEILGKTYGYIVYKLWQRIFENTALDNYKVIAVPMHSSRGRAYNQAEVIAQNVCVRTGFSLTKNALIKKRGIGKISSMPKNVKYQFAKDAFEVINSAEIYGKHIILIDDIYTTGTTASVCADLLLNNGASSVTVLTACYTPMK